MDVYKYEIKVSYGDCYYFYGSSHLTKDEIFKNMIAVGAVWKETDCYERFIVTRGSGVVPLPITVHEFNRIGEIVDKSQFCTITAVGKI